MSTYIANIKVTSKDVIKNWWKLNYFTGGSDPSSIITSVRFGYLYNPYTILNGNELAAIGWHVASRDEYITIEDSVGGYEIGGGHMKDISNDFWNSPNTGADNLFGFNARGGGKRNSDGTFADLKNISNIMTSDLVYETPSEIIFSYLHSYFVMAYFGEEKSGRSIRVIKDSTILENGESGIYVGNDDKVYRTICIGGLEILADNICETKLRNGTLIPEVTDNATWAALTTLARCSYNNDESNAIII